MGSLKLYGELMRLAQGYRGVPWYRGLGTEVTSWPTFLNTVL